MRVLCFINNYLRTFLRTWKEFLNRIGGATKSSYYSRKEMYVNGEMIEPKEGEVERYIYKEIRN